MIQRNRFLPLPRARFIQGPVGPRPILAGLLLGLTVWACGGEESTGPGGEQQPPSVASVAVTPSIATLVSLGETVQLNASAQDASGNAISGKTFTWSSSDAGVVAVSSSGEVTAVANGSVTITATADGVNGTAAVDVNQVATQLAFTVQPTDAVAGAPISPAIETAIQDASGSTAADATDAVTVAIETNAGGGTLSGTTTVNAVGGTASFADLSIDQSGPGYTLVATSGTLMAATSAAFDVCGEPAATDEFLARVCELAALCPNISPTQEEIDACPLGIRSAMSEAQLNELERFTTYTRSQQDCILECIGRAICGRFGGALSNISDSDVLEPFRACEQECL